MSYRFSVTAFSKKRMMIPFIFLVIFSRVIALGNGKRILLWGSGLSGIAVAAAFLCSSGVRDCVELGHGPAHSQVEDPDQLHGGWQNQRGNKGKQVAGEDKYKDRKNNISWQWWSWGFRVLQCLLFAAIMLCECLKPSVGGKASQIFLLQLCYSSHRGGGMTKPHDRSVGLFHTASPLFYLSVRKRQSS